MSGARLGCGRALPCSPQVEAAPRIALPVGLQPLQGAARSRPRAWLPASHCPPARSFPAQPLQPPPLWQWYIEWTIESWPSVPQVPLPSHLFTLVPKLQGLLYPYLCLLAPFFSALWGAPAPLAKGPLPYVFPRLDQELPYLWSAAATLTV